MQCDKAEFHGLTLPHYCYCYYSKKSYNSYNLYCKTCIILGEGAAVAQWIVLMAHVQLVVG